MAFRLGASPRAGVLHFRKHNPRLVPAPEHAAAVVGRGKAGRRGLEMRVGVSSGGGGDSYLDMWKKAVDGERKAAEFQKIVENASSKSANTIGGDTSPEELARKSEEFTKILEVSREERDRVQRMQVIDRAAAAIAAARSVLEESRSTGEDGSGDLGSSGAEDLGDGGTGISQEGKICSFVTKLEFLFCAFC